MPNFKPKNEKHIVTNKKHLITLDGMHKAMTTVFKMEREQTVPKLNENIDNLLKKIKVPENPGLDVTTDVNCMDDQFNIRDQVDDLRKQIDKIKHKEKDYLLTNIKYVFDYFDNKKRIAESNTNNVLSGNMVSSSATCRRKNTLLDEFFKPKKSLTEEYNENTNTNSIGTSTINTANIIPAHYKYFTNIDHKYIQISNLTVNSVQCKSCGNGEMIAVEHEGVMVCNQCGQMVKYLIDNEKSSYKEVPKEASFYAYKRINHFREILSQFQGKETTNIPPEVLFNIHQQIKKERIELSQLNNKKTKDILKKLGYNKYYEHIPFIKHKLGIKPPIMHADLEDTLCSLFTEIQVPYAKYCPDDRVNFLNYYYTIYKLCELLDQRQFLPFFPMLKDRDKRVEQDEIWRKICNELNWVFIPTI